MYSKILHVELELEVCLRADEWNVNKWAWEGSLKVISKGEECIIKLEDKTTGERSSSNSSLKWFGISAFSVVYLTQSEIVESRWTICSGISEKWRATSRGTCDWQQQILCSSSWREYWYVFFTSLVLDLSE